MPDTDDSGTRHKEQAVRAHGTHVIRLGLAGVILAACGCALFLPPTEPPPQKRGKLSEAMEKSAGKRPKERQVADSRQAALPVSESVQEVRGAFLSGLVRGSNHEPVSGPEARQQPAGPQQTAGPDTADSAAQPPTVLQDSTEHDGEGRPPAQDTAHRSDSLSRTAADSAESRDIESAGAGPARLAWTVRSRPSRYTVSRGSASEPPPDTPDTPASSPSCGRPGRATVFLGVEAYAAYVGSAEYDNVNGGRAWIAFHAGLWMRHAVGAGLGVLNIKRHDPLWRSVEDALQIDVDYQFRLYLNPSHTLVGPFVCASLAGRELFWGYRHPVWSDVYDQNDAYLRTDTVTTDRLTGCAAEIGLGADLLRTRRYRLSLKPCIGGTIYWVWTGEGFTNDVFGPEWYIKVSLESAWGVAGDDDD